MFSRWFARMFLSCTLVAAVLISGTFTPHIAHGAPISSPSLQSSPIERLDQIREGEAEFTDDFSAIDSIWQTSYDGETAGYYKAGAYHISINTDNLVVWESGDIAVTDFLAEADVAHYDGPLVNEGGLLFRYVDSDNFYSFMVSSDGFYVVKKQEDGEWVTLVDWEESDVAETGPQSTNRLGILAEGAQLAFFINDELVAEVEDDSFAEGGIALAAGTLDEFEVDIAFDNFALWPVDVGQQPDQPIIGIPGRRVPDAPTPQLEDEPLSVEERVAAIRSSDPVFSEDFSAGSGDWDSASTEETIYDFADETFYLRVLPVDWVSYSQTDNVYADFLVEVDATHSVGPLAVEYGLYFRNVDGNNYYYFGISANGQFNLWKRIDGEWLELIAWTASDALETGEGAYNRIGVLADGPILTLLANDVVLAEVEDDSLAGGAIGVFVRTYDEEDIEIAFDNFDVWELTPSSSDEPSPPAIEDVVDAAQVEARIRDIYGAEPTVSEQFRADTGDWSISASDDVRMEVRRRRLHINVDSPNWITWSLYTTEMSDFLMEADVETVTSPLDGSFGMIFRTLDADNFYIFRISPRGTFSFMKKADGEWTTLTDWTASDAIDTADGAVNRLGVLAEGSQLALLINEVVVAQAVDADLTEGQVGLAAGVYDEAGLEVAFDNVDIWDLAQ